MNYNWDDMECNPDSYSFFDKRHSKHEKIDNTNSNHVNNDDEKDKENKRNIININHFSDEVQNIQINNVKVENIDAKEKPQKESEMVKENVTEVNDIENNNHGNIIQGVCSLKKESFTVNKNIPSVYKYVQIYEQNKQQNFKKIMNEDLKNRIFHARAAPKYNAITLPEKKVNKVTVPVTPKVLKKSKEFEERRKKIAEQNKVVMPKLTPRDANVVHEKPFKPDLKVKNTTNVKPFQLKVTSRLEERKLYDDDYKQRREEQKKQKEELEKQENQNIIQKIRKNTTFKARPNPFK